MNWTCPYCGQPTTITSLNRDDSWTTIDIAADHIIYQHRLGLHNYAIVCPNPDCKNLFLTVDLKNSINPMARWEEGVKTIGSWQLLPESASKPQPNYIPRAILKDYTEACRIKDLSPKASATLARRCLQGMVRDFHGVSGNTLADEIDALQGQIPQADWDAIDALRQIGNIGAHMEKDVNLIIDIDPDEAAKLIQLIEYLFKQWYVARHEAQENLAAIKRLAGTKKAEKKAH